MKGRGQQLAAAAIAVAAAVSAAGCGSDYRFREVIDRGRGGTCKGVGVVRLTPDGDFLEYRFRGGGVESHGVLSRVGG